MNRSGQLRPVGHGVLVAAVLGCHSGEVFDSFGHFEQNEA